jgi:hypothetical protein
MLLSIKRYIEVMYDPQSRPSKRTVERWLAAGELPYPVERYGRRVFISVPDEELPREAIEPPPDKQPGAKVVE